MKSFTFVWVSKYALTSGVQRFEAEIDDEYALVSGHWNAFRMGKDAHLTEEAALKAAEAMRLAKITSLKKQLAKVERLSFCGGRNE